MVTAVLSLHSDGDVNQKHVSDIGSYLIMSKVE